MVKMETGVVRPLKPLFYSEYVWTIFIRCRNDYFDEVFQALDIYHENIDLTIELSPSKFLDTELINVEGKYITKVHRKKSKLTIRWSSKIPKQYKRNTITTDLHEAENIALNMKQDIPAIHKKVY